MSSMASHSIVCFMLCVLAAGCSGPSSTASSSSDLAGMGEEEQLLYAVRIGDTSTIGRFLDAYPDVIHERDNTGDTLLHRAVRAGQPVSVKFLLERGADPEAINGEGDNAMDIAVDKTGDPEIIELLREAGNP